LIPVFIVVMAGAIRRRQSLLLAYAAPPFSWDWRMGRSASEYTLHLGFIGPIAVAATVLALRLPRDRRWLIVRSRAASAAVKPS